MKKIKSTINCNVMYCNVSFCQIFITRTHLLSGYSKLKCKHSFPYCNVFLSLKHFSSGYHLVIAERENYFFILWVFTFWQCTEAVIQSCSVKKILQNSEENVCTRVVFLIKFEASTLQLLKTCTPRQLFIEHLRAIPSKYQATFTKLYSLPCRSFEKDTLHKHANYSRLIFFVKILF